MRVLQFLFTAAVVLIILGGVTFLIGREALLWWGISTVRESVASLRQISVNAGPYYLECRKKGAADGPDVLGAIQLRFTSPTEYVVEVVCSQFQLDPIIVTEATLPRFVKNKPGQAGLLWGEPRSGLTLEVWGRSQTILVENREIKVVNGAEVDLGISPVASCQGFGFTCCNVDTALGLGAQLTGVSDCPQTCFSSCQERPAVLSFYTQPFFDPATRVLDITSGESVEFSYVVQLGPSNKGSLILDYGDGETADVEVPRGKIDHVYACAQSECRYTAQLQLTDSAGTAAVSGAVNQVLVIVRP